MIQIDGPRRKVYLKFMNNEHKMVVLNPIHGPLECHHENGEFTLVNVEIAGIGMRRLRVAGLPPEVPNSVMTDTRKIL
jgi:hypothetical protein